MNSHDVLDGLPVHAVRVGVVDREQRPLEYLDVSEYAERLRLYPVEQELKLLNHVNLSPFLPNARYAGHE